MREKEIRLYVNSYLERCVFINYGVCLADSIQRG